MAVTLMLCASRKILSSVRLWWRHTGGTDPAIGFTIIRSVECNQCEHLVHRELVTWLVTFLKQTEQGYLDGPGFGCTSPARANSRSSGS